MTTIVDSLIVTLGLDSKGFKKGAGEADKAIKDVQSDVVKSAQSMVSALSRVAAEFVGLFLVVRSVHDIVDFFADINEATRQLGFDSKNFGIAAGELRDWQNAAEIAGGRAEDVAKTVESFQRSLFNLKFNGVVSDQLIYLARLGVAFQTTAGQVRPFKDILFDTARALERSNKSRPEKYEFLKGAGFDEGSINLILGGTKALEEAYEKQQRLQQINERNTRAAQKLAEAWIYLKQSLTAAATQILTNLTPYLEQLFTTMQKDFPAKLQELADWVKGGGAASIKGFFEGLNTIVRTLADTIDYAGKTFTATFGSGSTLDTVAKWWVAITGGAPVELSDSAAADARSRALRNNNPGNLKATGNQIRDPQGFAIFATREEGIAAANNQLDLYAKRGINTIGSIASTWAPPGDGNNLNNYILGLMKATGKGPNDVLGPEDRANLLRGIFGNEDAPNAPSGKAIGRILRPVPGAARAAQGAGATPSVQSSPPISSTAGPSNSVQIDQITVNTQATDANRIAADMGRAVQRKFNVAYADGGLV